MAGSAALVAAASTSGIQIENGATGNDVGGTVAGARNVISGNGGPGVSILSDGNRVEGNYIGTDATGTQSISNNVGVSIAGSHNTVGGTVFAENVRALAFEGRLATVGYVDGVVHADIDLEALHAKRLTLFGVSNKLRTKEQRSAAVPRLQTRSGSATMSTTRRRGFSDEIGS